MQSTRSYRCLVGPIGIAMVVAVAIASCGDDSTKTTAFQSALVAAATTPLPAAAVSDDALRAVVGCPDCTVVARSTMTLPLTKKTFVEAKLLSGAGSAPYAAALDLGGNPVGAQGLVAAEGVAKMARQGKLRDAVYARTLTSSSDLIPVSIWADFADGHEPREQMASDSSFRAARQAQTASRLHAVTSKVTAWLDARGFATHDRGIDTPLITADVPASALAELGRLDGIAVVDQRYPEVLDGFTWFDAVKGEEAGFIVGSAAGQSFCNGEGTQPDYYGYLSAPIQTLDPTSATSGHARWTTELIAANAAITMAPGASSYLPAYIGGTAQYTDFQAWSWCFGLGITNMNRSTSFGSGPNGLLPEDMAQDYYVYHWPYPLVTLSAGNCVNGYGGGVDCITGSPVNGAYVGNRSHNTLVVGASDSHATPQTSDDFMAYFSQYINPATPHDDFELPNLVAPGSDMYGSNIDSASYEDAGTSASAPIVMGTALLMKASDSTFGIWPEMMRATILAASTHPVDGPRTTRLGLSDLRQGAGLLNAQIAVTLADPSFVTGPNNTAASAGRNGSYYDFGADFPNGVSAPYNIVTPIGGRLRVVIAWDATAVGCNATDGSGCTSDTIDADLDLHLFKYVNGGWQVACYSSTWDSSWELCDIPVNSGDLYMAEIAKYTTNSAGTYLGIAWSNYDPSSE